MRFPKRPRPAFQRFFISWYEEKRSLFPLPLRLLRRTDSRIEMAFKGIESLVVSLTRDELEVHVFWQGQLWDIIMWLDASTILVPGGYQCIYCEERRTFWSREDLWRDHLFEPFLEWVTFDLSKADHVAIYNNMDGCGWARLISSNAHPEPEGLAELIAIGNQVRV